MKGWQLMENNIGEDDFENLIDWLKTYPRLTNGPKVKEFEKIWSEWVGTKYSVFVNSGATANLLSVMALDRTGRDEILVSPLNWISDISSIINNGYKPVFVDINPDTMGIDNEKAIYSITPNTAAVLLTHICGFNALDKRLHDVCKLQNIPIIEDVCESHGTISYNGKRCGSNGTMSCFSFYYGHHITTVEGGMICTDDEELYQKLRMLRSHGLVRESTSDDIVNRYDVSELETSKGFVFAYNTFNYRNTEIAAVMGIRQMERLDDVVERRKRNLETFLSNLDETKYKTDFRTEGNSSFALILIVKHNNQDRVDRICRFLKKNSFEYRRGTIAGNQLRQPYLNRKSEAWKYPNTDYIHYNGLYIGNFADLEEDRIKWLCEELNNL